MFIDNIPPSPALRAFIRIYRIIDFYFPDAPPPFPKLYTPRPETCLQFYPKDREKLTYPDSQQLFTGISSSFSGQHTVTQNRFVPKSFLSVQVIFQPGAFTRITGIPVSAMTNTLLPAEEVFGKTADQVTEQLLYATDYPHMIRIIENYLLQIMRKKDSREHRVGQIARIMLQDNGAYSLDYFLKEACYSQRQFDRKFTELMGISPKRYLRIIRFDRAFRMKNRYPEKDWLSIALHCGYYDYQHLAKDYQEFTGLTPAQFFETDNQGPDRLAGVAEV
jgi:AraC-like DNA-binding protein